MYINNTKRNSINQIVPTKVVEAVVFVISIVMLHQIDAFQYLPQHPSILMSDIKLLDMNAINANAILATNSSHTTRPDLIVGSEPRGIAANPNTDLIYVANNVNGTVSVINDSGNNSGKNNSTNAAATFKTITVGKSPEGIAVNPETNMAYVPNGDSNSTSVIDGKTNKVVANVSVGPSPHSVAVNPNTNLIYVSNRGFPLDNITTTNTDSNTVSVIDGKTNKVVANVTVG